MQPNMHIAPGPILPGLGFEKTDTCKKGQGMGALKKHHATGQGEDATQYAYCTSPLLPELGFYKTDADQKGQGMGAPNKPHAAR